MSSINKFSLVFILNLILSDLSVASTSTSNLISNYTELNYILFSLPIIIIIFVFLAKQVGSPKISNICAFEIITPHKKSQIIKIDENIENMVQVEKCIIDKSIKIYSNLFKIVFSVKNNGILIEDKNFKNSILVNRRRSRKHLLQAGDIIDMGELTLLVHFPLNITNTKPLLEKKSKITGKIISYFPTLIPADSRKKQIILSKNIIFIGKSETNDVVIQNKGIALKHIKIERISNKYKLTDLSNITGTFVNGKRVQEYILAEGDEISMDSIKYRFGYSKQYKI